MSTDPLLHKVSLPPLSHVLSTSPQPSLPMTPVTPVPQQLPLPHLSQQPYYIVPALPQSSSVPPMQFVFATAQQQPSFPVMAFPFDFQSSARVPLTMMSFQQPPQPQLNPFPFQMCSSIPIPTTSPDTTTTIPINTPIVKRRSMSSVIIRKYKCNLCEKTFTTSGHLARHTRIHTGERKYECPFQDCKARFSRQDNCMQHYRTHFSNKSRKRQRNLSSSSPLIDPMSTSIINTIKNTNKDSELTSLDNIIQKRKIKQ